VKDCWASGSRLGWISSLDGRAGLTVSRIRAAAQMQRRSRASSGTCSSAAGGIDAVKHQQVLSPAARPQPFGPPHSGQVSWDDEAARDPARRECNSRRP
jgi:hypothetical protein